MTPKEKASWQRWHKYGRRRYQLRMAGRGLLVGLFFACWNIARYPNASPAGPLLVALGWGISVYFFAGHHWNARDEEYRWLTERDSQA